MSIVSRGDDLPTSLRDLVLLDPRADGMWRKQNTFRSIDGPRFWRVADSFGSSPAFSPFQVVPAVPPTEHPAPRSEWAALTHDFRDYVNRLADERDGGRQIDHDLARTALKVWWKCFGSFDGSLAIPDVAAGEAGELVFIWKRDQHYLSIEMALGVPFEVFYRNGRTGTIWGLDLDPSDREIPGPILGRMAYFVADE